MSQPSNTPEVDYIANGLEVLFRKSWGVLSAVVGSIWSLVSLVVNSGSSGDD